MSLNSRKSPLLLNSTTILVCSFMLSTGLALAVESPGMSAKVTPEIDEEMAFDMVIIKSDGEFPSISVAIGSGEKITTESGYIDADDGVVVDFPEDLPAGAEVIGSYSSVVVFGNR